MSSMNFKSAVLIFIFGSFGLMSAAQNTSQQPQSTTETKDVAVRTYDPARNAALDIEQAIVEARKTGKHILLEVGGDWCPWCRTLDRFFQEHPDVRQLREANFVVVNVYYSTEKKNEQVLSRYPKLLGIPHIFILDTDGTLLHSQHAVELETDGDYNSGKMKDFLNRWSPPAVRGGTDAR